MTNNKKAAHAAKRLYDEALSHATATAPDLGRAFKLLSKAVEIGSPDATYAMATWYLFGQEPYVKKNLATATRLLRLASDGGVASASYDLAVSYEKGMGVRKNLRLAFECYLRAALRNDSQSVCEVGRCLHWGIGTEQNRRAARIWFDRAEELGTYEMEEEP